MKTQNIIQAPSTNKMTFGIFRTVIALFLCQGFIAHAAPLFTDANFVSFPTGWNQSNAVGATSTVETGFAPSGGVDTNSLNILDNSSTTTTSVKPAINGGSTFTSAMTISFDFTMNLVMVDPTTTQSNMLFLRVYDGSGITNSAHTAAAILFARAGGAGDSTSRLNFSNGSGTVFGFFDPNAWYHLELSLSAVGGSGSVATLTSLGSGILRNAANTANVSSLSISQSLGGSVTDFQSLFLASGNIASYYSDANIANIVAVPEPATWLLFAIGLLAVSALPRRQKI